MIRTLLLLGAAVLPLAAVDVEPVDPRADGAFLARAEKAFEEERYADALAALDTLRARRPDSAEIPFNMGVAAYRQGDLARAAELFDEARLKAADPVLRARSAYNHRVGQGGGPCSGARQAA